MDLSTKVLGSDVVKSLTERRVTPILRIGSDTFTRAQLAKVECFNFTAAQNLSLILNAHLKVPNLRHVFDKVSPEALALPRLGAISLAVLGAAFEALHIGGHAPLESYCKKHLNGRGIVTFNSIKLREQKEGQDERARERDRKHSRRNRAHHIRSRRFASRHASR